MTNPLAILCVIGSCISLQLGASLAIQLFPHAGTWGNAFADSRGNLIAFRTPQGAYVEPGKVDFGCAVWRVIGVDEWLLLRVVPLGPAVTIEFVGPLLLTAVLSRSLRDATCVALAIIGMALLGVDSLTGEPLNPRGALVLVSDPWLLFVALGTGVLASLIPYSLEFIALKRLAPNMFSILIALEPVFAAFFGWLLLSPGVTALKLTAIALVVLASVVQTMVPARGRIIFRTIALRPRAPWRFRRPQN